MIIFMIVLTLNVIQYSKFFSKQFNRENIMRINQEDLDRRHHEMLQFVQENRQVDSAAIADRFHISLVTVRRDLRMLEEKGLLQRTHGGARSLDNDADAGSSHSDVIQRCREAISQYAASLVDENDTIFINGSRTALYMLQHVESKTVNVYTNNGWAIGTDFPPNVNIQIVGGKIFEHVLVGDYTMRNLLEITADKAFLGCAAVYDDGEFGYDIPTEIGINEAMISMTKGQLYMLIDHGKLVSRYASVNRYGSFRYNRPVTLITDSMADTEILNNLRSKGIDIITVPV